MDPVPTPAQPVTREMVLDARLPSAVSSERAEVRRIRILAGQAAGRDVHNGPALGSILEGSVLFQVERRDEARSFARAMSSLSLQACPWAAAAWCHACRSGSSVSAAASARCAARRSCPVAAW